MAKATDINIDKKLQKKSETFIKKINSDMYFSSEFIGDSMTFDWLDELELACPYIDNIIRNPKLTLFNEEDVVKIEKAKKITVASVKDLSKHTHFIEKIDKKTDEVQPSKILIVRNEETFNIYENRFIYTLIENLIRFISKKKALLENMEISDDKVLEYAASTNTGDERVNIQLKISSKELPKGQEGNQLKKEIDIIKTRIKKIMDYIHSWKRSELMCSLEKERVAFVSPPIKKTNIILKNTNFQIAMRLWGFLQTYDYKDNNSSKDNLDTSGDDVLKGLLDDSFLMNYYVIDSISSSKRERKQKLAKYAVVMVNQQIKRVVSLLLNNGIEITDEDILRMVSNEIKTEKSNRLVGSVDVKKKFKSAVDEFLERTKDYL